MKAKRLDSARLKQFLAAHIEKIAFAVFSFVFLWLCYSAYETKGYDKTPKDLGDKTDSTRSIVESQPWSPADWNIKLPDPPYVKQVEVVMKPVDAKPFALATLFDLPIRENKVRRDEPKFLPVHELAVTFGFGAVRPKKDAPLGEQWAVITGLVPIAEQAAEYQKLFENAWYVNPNLDTPQWIDFQVERAQVASAGGGNEQWEPIDVHGAIKKEFETFFQERPEVVDKKFQERSLIDPVPPLIGREPDDSMAHPPAIPFVLQAKDKDAQQKQPEQATDNGANPLLGGNDQARRFVVPIPTQAGQQPQEVIPFHLFRFFDYTVENDRMYRYRVKVVLRNPNFEVAKRYLKNPEFAVGDRRESAWSEASPVVTTPPDSRMLAGDVTPQRGLNEARAKVLVIKWEGPKAVEVPHEFELLRGSYINFPDEDTPIPVPGEAEKTVPGKVSFESNTLLVDIIGGEQVTGPTGQKIRTPSLMLFMGPAGEIVMHKHLDDLVEFNARRPAPPPSTRGKKPAAEDADAAVDPLSEPAKPGGRRPAIFDLRPPK
jgi:hypothetical protein